MAAADQFDFRPADKDEMPFVNRLRAYVFADVEQLGEEDDILLPEWTHCAFHGGRVVASSAGIPFQMRLNGKRVMADGVTAVGTDPGFRRQGLVRRLIDDRLKLARENRQPVAILWASKGAIYQRFGYGLASTQVEYSFDPRFADFQYGEPASGYARQLARTEAVPVVSKLYRRFIEPRNLLLHRPAILWDLPFRERAGHPKAYCAVHYNNNHSADGYALYTLRRLGEPSSDPAPEQGLELLDFVWRDMNGYRGLWEYLRGHDLVGKVTTAFAAEDDPAPAMLLEPRVLQRRTSDGLWLRVVDVAATLAQRGYDHAGETTLAIREDVECPWNVGSYRLAAEAGQAEVQKIDAEAEIAISPQGLASLVAGHARLSQLVRIGRAEVRSQRRLPTLDALFSTRYRPHCMNGF